jgi:hypothetical protein
MLTGRTPCTGRQSILIRRTVSDIGGLHWGAEAVYVQWGWQTRSSSFTFLHASVITLAFELRLRQPKLDPSQNWTAWMIKRLDPRSSRSS